MLLSRLKHEAEEFTSEIGFETSKRSSAGLTLLLFFGEIGLSWFAVTQADLSNHVERAIQPAVATDVELPALLTSRGALDGCAARIHSKGVLRTKAPNVTRFSK